MPRNLPYPPTYAKVNPADAPIITLALTSATIALRDMSDLADTLLAQRLSEVTGVGRVSVQGGIRPAVRIQADLSRLAAYGIGLEDVRQAIVGANVSGPKGALDGAHQSYTIAANDQLANAKAYRSLVVAYRNSAPVLLSDVADIVDGLENAKVGAWYQGTPAVIIDIQRQPGANVIETVDRVKAQLPRLQRAMPAGVTLTIVNDRTNVIRASIHDVPAAHARHHHVGQEQVEMRLGAARQIRSASPRVLRLEDAVAAAGAGSRATSARTASSSSTRRMVSRAAQVAPGRAACPSAPASAGPSARGR